MKLGGNPFRTILHISFLDVENFWVAAARPIQARDRSETDLRPETGPDRTSFNDQSDGPDEDINRFRYNSITTDWK